MRLVCPNCGAQYEVPEEVIPENGRDVQCSSCGDTWFQQHPDQIAAEAEAEAQAAEQANFLDADDAQSDIAQPAWDDEGSAALAEEDLTAPANAQDTAPDYGLSDEADDESAHQGEAETEDEAPFIEITEDAFEDEGAEHDTSPAAHPDAQDFGDTDEGTQSEEANGEDAGREDAGGEDTGGEDTGGEAEAPVGLNDLPRRALDPSVAELLREEAERESRARAAESNSDFETQGDLGLEEPSGEASRREREAQLRMARMRGEPEPRPESASAALGGSRRDLLPDIEEINSTLRSARDRKPAAADDHEGAHAEGAPRKRGFRSGFGMALTAAIVLAVIYLNAPRISAAIPALAPLIDGYAAKVDGARGWLDGKMVAMMTQMDEMAAPQSGGGANGN